jgi:dTMP kinase
MLLLTAQTFHVIVPDLQGFIQRFAGNLEDLWRVEVAETGRLIILEGLNNLVLGALAERLCYGLRAQGIAAEHTREPTYGPAGAQVRLARQGRLQLDPVSLALLCLADRLDHLDREDGIRAWLAAGRHVLCVHYALYAYAWQWDQVDWDWQRRIEAPCPVPDLTLYVDAPFSASEGACVGDAEVLGANAERLEKGYYRAIACLQDEGQPVVMVDGRGALDEVYHVCRGHVADLGAR